MSIPATGPINYRSPRYGIAVEYPGGAQPDNLGEYYRGGLYVQLNAAPTIATGGTLKFSMYRGTTAPAPYPQWNMNAARYIVGSNARYTLDMTRLFTGSATAITLNPPVAGISVDASGQLRLVMYINKNPRDFKMNAVLQPGGAVMQLQFHVRGSYTPTTAPKPPPAGTTAPTAQFTSLGPSSMVTGASGGVTVAPISGGGYTVRLFGQGTLVKPILLIHSGTVVFTGTFPVNGATNPRVTLTFSAGGRLTRPASVTSLTANRVAVYLGGGGAAAGQVINVVVTWDIP
jgi:hypothetical protein